MKQQVYTAQQVAYAIKILNAIASVPPDKQGAYVDYIEALFTGAAIACKSQQRSA